MVKIRPAVAADVPALVDVHFAAVHSTAANSYTPDVLACWSAAPSETRHRRMMEVVSGGDELVLAAERESRVIGFGSIVPTLHELRAVYVDPTFGRQGVGSMIVDGLERLALQRGVWELRLSASINSETFYFRAGYQPVERTTIGSAGTWTWHA